MVFPKVRVVCSSPSANAGNATASLFSPVHLMSLPAIFVGILVLVVIAPLQAQPLIPAGNSQNFEYKSFCSKSLSDFLSLICGVRYSSQQYAQYQQTADNNGAFNSNILRRLSTEDGIYVRARRIHECCLRPCGFSELKMLCEPPA
ncbi:hypothetical protein DOY81_003498 [Sarcophaga bullata]|nr:hypothetical protein DOY81_003498 [Sarcophaga bullata]